jgi:hypothetical protein
MENESDNRWVKKAVSMSKVDANVYGGWPPYNATRRI